MDRVVAWMDLKCSIIMLIIGAWLKFLCLAVLFLVAYSWIRLSCRPSPSVHLFMWIPGVFYFCSRLLLLLRPGTMHELPPHVELHVVRTLMVSIHLSKESTSMAAGE